MERQPFWVRFADLPVWVAPEFEYPRLLWEDYVITPTEQEQQAYFTWREKNNDCSGQPLYSERTDIETLAEDVKQVFGDETCPQNFYQGMAEGFTIFAQIVADMWTEELIMFHCSSLMVDGKAYLFTAPSGTGKSTHTGLWRERFGSRVTMIDDDKPFLRLMPDGTWRIYGMPYGGKEHIRANISAPVAGIVELHQAPQNTIRRISAHEAYPFLLNQTFQNWTNKQALARTMELAYDLAAKIPVYEMGCTPTPDAAELSYAALVGAGEEK